MQDLHSVTYLLASISNVLHPDPRDKLNDVEQIAQDVIPNFRDRANELRPPAIMDFGLEKTIRSLYRRFKRKISWDST